MGASPRHRSRRAAGGHGHPAAGGPTRPSGVRPVAAGTVRLPPGRPRRHRRRGRGPNVRRRAGARTRGRAGPARPQSGRARRHDRASSGAGGSAARRRTHLPADARGRGRDQAAARVHWPRRTPPERVAGPRRCRDRRPRRRAVRRPPLHRRRPPPGRRGVGRVACGRLSRRFQRARRAARDGRPAALGVPSPDHRTGRRAGAVGSAPGGVRRRGRGRALPGRRARSGCTRTGAGTT